MFALCSEEDCILFEDDSEIKPGLTAMEQVKPSHSRPGGPGTSDMHRDGSRSACSMCKLYGGSRLHWLERWNWFKFDVDEYCERISETWRSGGCVPAMGEFR